MGAVAFAGTGVIEAVGVGQFTNAIQKRFTLNNTYKCCVNPSGQVTLAKNGAAVFVNPATLSQSVVQQLWQDLAQIGLAH